MTTRIGITGITANPTIFENTIVGTHDYYETIRTLGAASCPPIQIYETSVQREDHVAA